jgi:putative sterol carrier protein
MDAERVLRDARVARRPGQGEGHDRELQVRIDGSGTWHVDVDDGKVTVTRTAATPTARSRPPGDVQKIANREQNPTAAYMSGKLKVKGDMGQAMKLQKLF